MIRITQGYSLEDRGVAGMFEDRKRLFVDLLDWDVPVVDSRFEIDQFDGPDATYLLALDDAGSHQGSLRLLPTNRPHILGTLFANLCDRGVPAGPDIVEITRLCLPVRLRSKRRLAVRNRLISAMTDLALSAGVAAFTGVVSWRFLEQIMAMGWRCVPLGGPCVIGGTRLGAFRIDLDAGTPAALASTGIYVPDCIAVSALRKAA